MVQIKKYPNRRYYDATHSRHVTLQEVYEIIMRGDDVMVTDSRNGDDITNLVLTQILLERDEPKLDLFPSSMLHMMIRSNRQVLRAWLERAFGPFLGLLSSSQKQFDAYWRQAVQGPVITPMEWANRMMQAFSGSMPGSPPPASPTPDAPATEANSPSERLDDLRRDLADLQRKFDELNVKRPSP